MILFTVVRSIYYYICCCYIYHWISWQLTNQLWYTWAGICFILYLSSVFPSHMFLALRPNFSLAFTGRTGAFLCSSDCLFIRKFLDELHGNREGDGSSGESSSGTDNEALLIQVVSLTYLHFLDSTVCGHSPRRTGRLPTGRLRLAVPRAGWISECYSEVWANITPCFAQYHLHHSGWHAG